MKQFLITFVNTNKNHTMMRTKLKGFLTLLLVFALQATFAQQKVTGTVTDANTGEPLPGVNIVIEGTQKGTVTDFDGKYTITASPDDVLVFSYVGYNEVKEKVGNRSVINVKLVPGEVLETVVVDISGQKREVKTLSYDVQQVKAEKLEISDIANVESALAGKVAGAQVLDQAGSKLGYGPKVRLRGRIALTSDSDPLYVVDGVPVGDASVIDPDNIESIEVLKGPNATAIYGQRGINGVVVITTKKAKKGLFGVDINSKVTFEKIAYLPKYQNSYGQGYDGELEWYNFPDNGWGLPASFFAFSINGWDDPVFRNNPTIFSSYADESWGPKFDGRDYLPWYSWMPDSPYYKKTAKWQGQPDNVKNFYDTGVYLKNSVSISSAGDGYKANFSFSDLSQKGVIPYSTYNRYFVNGNMEFDVTKHLTLGLFTSYSKYKRHGDFNDSYGNQTSGSFNAWFGRQMDMAKQKELIDLKTPEGYYHSWNWWNPFIYSVYGTFFNEDFKKAVFWFNPYTWLRDYDRNGNGTSLLANIWTNFKITDGLSLKLSVTRNEAIGAANYRLPYNIHYSSGHDLYVRWVNSMGIYDNKFTEDNYNFYVYYTPQFDSEDFSLETMFGGNMRKSNYASKSAWMDPESLINYLVIPDVYQFQNTKNPVPVIRNMSRKKTYSLFGKATFGYKNLLFVEATARQDWSSALFPERNGYFYPSVGISFNFTELEGLQDNSILSSGKFRMGWAQVGSDVAAHRIYPRYRFLGNIPYNGISTLLTPSYFVDQNLVPAINSSFETGFDLKFFENRAYLNLTYYFEKRKNEIVTISVPSTTGYAGYLTNGGKSHRSGIEVSLGGNLLQKDDFGWDVDVNFSKNKTIVDEVPTGEEMIAPGYGDQWRRVFLVHKEGMEWGQLKGYKIKRDDSGNPILSSRGYFIPEETYYGSVLPAFTGGFTNIFSYKNFRVAAHFTFQKGGKFYSGSEVWGWYSGLYEETGLNGDREGGITVKGVDASGNSVSHHFDYDVTNNDPDVQSYFGQFHGSDITEFFVHDASYLKLRELSLSYSLPKDVLGKYLKGASISLIGTNVWLIAVSKDNYHRWDPSELSDTYGEDAQLPGTRRFGMNIKLRF